MERIISNACNTVRNRYACKAGTTRERIISNACNTIAYYNFFNRSILKAIINSIAIQFYFFKVTTLMKSNSSARSRFYMRFYLHLYYMVGQYKYFLSPFGTYTAIN